MSIDRFDTDRQQLPRPYEQALEVLEEFAFPVLIEIADTGTAGTINTVRHGLGRKPRSVQISRCVVATGTGVVAPAVYQEADDNDWTNTEMNIRFSEDNLRVVLEIY